MQFAQDLRVMIAVVFAGTLYLTPASRGAEVPGQPVSAVRISPTDSANAAEILAGKVLSSEPNSIATLAPPKRGERYIVLHVEFESVKIREQFRPPTGAFVMHAYSRFADMLVTGKDALESLANSPDIRWIEIGGVAFAPPPREPEVLPERPRGDRHAIIRGGLEGLTGKGVLIAVIDSGIDFRHPDFVREDSEGKPVSRILYLWDTLAQPAEGRPGRHAPIHFPSGDPFGIIYSSEDLTKELSSTTRTIPPTDTNGHGTAVAGIAAGNGFATTDRRYAGVAPGADLIAVRIGTGPGLENAFLLPAVIDWLDAVAGDRPLVINCSFGNSSGSHDGFGIVERHVSERLPENRKGRVVCIAAGNEGDAPVHALLQTGDEKSKSEIRWKAPLGGRLRLYMDGVEPSKIKVSAPSLGSDAVRNFTHPLSKSLVFEIVMSEQETGTVTLSTTGTAKISADAYISGLEARLIGQNVTPSVMVASPGGTASAITLGSYDFEDLFERPSGLFRYKVAAGEELHEMSVGKLSAYSCPGLIRGGRGIKPDVVAPGQYHTAAAAGDAKITLLDACGKYRLFNGTSAATPYMAGVVALLMERKPGLTAAEIKKLLKEHATLDKFTTDLPNASWGYGKLDMAAVRKIATALK